MTTSAIETEGLVRTFGKVRALDGIDMVAREGTVFGLLGPNGAGKTTAIRVLSTLLRPDAGRAVVGRLRRGARARQGPKPDRAHRSVRGRRRAALGPGEPVHDRTAAGHARRRRRRARAKELLDVFDLSDAATKYVKTYSGGMRRRLDLAASLVGRPRFLYLDEPTTGLDPRSRLELWGMIRALVARGNDRAAHDPVPRGGRPARRRDRRDRPRQGDRRRHAPAAEDPRRRAGAPGAARRSRGPAGDPEDPRRLRGGRGRHAQRRTARLGADQRPIRARTGRPAARRRGHRRRRPLAAAPEPGRGVPRRHRARGRRRPRRRHDANGGAHEHGHPRHRSDARTLVSQHAHDRPAQPAAHQGHARAAGRDDDPADHVPRPVRLVFGGAIAGS